MTDPLKARVAGAWFREDNTGQYLAYLSALLHAENLGKRVYACPKTARRGSCPEHPDDGIWLNEHERELLR